MCGQIGFVWMGKGVFGVVLVQCLKCIVEIGLVVIVEDDGVVVLCGNQFGDVCYDWFGLWVGFVDFIYGCVWF